MLVQKIPRQCHTRKDEKWPTRSVACWRDTWLRHRIAIKMNRGWLIMRHSCFSCSNSHFQCIVAMLRGAVWVIDVSGCNLEVQSFLCVIHLLSASNVRMKLLTDFACALDVTYWLHTARVAKLFKYFGIMGSWLPGLAQKPAGVPVVLGLVTCQHENWLCQFVVLKIQFLQNVCALFFCHSKGIFGASWATAVLCSLRLWEPSSIPCGHTLCALATLVQRADQHNPCCSLAVYQVS